jgi:membrane protein DedA with SNARE-associated domain
MLDSFLAWLAALPPVPAYATLMALSAIENVFPPAPADVAVVLGAFVARRGPTSVVLMGVLCWAANTVSSCGLYFYARRQGREWLDHPWAKRLLPPDAVRALEDAYARHGIFGIFMSRFLPGVRAAVTPVAGVMGVGPWRALVPASLASAIWYAALVGLGAGLGLNWDAARAVVDDLSRALGIASALLVLLGALWLWRRRRSRAS